MVKLLSNRLLSLSGSLLLVLLTPPAAGAVEVGDRAPDFTMTDLITEEPFSLSEFRGKVVVLNFWAYW